MTADIFASAHGPIEPRPFDVGPLLEAAHEPSLSRAALRLGVPRSSLSDAVVSGLTWHQADTWACRLGRHPAELWAHWYAEIDDDA